MGNDAKILIWLTKEMLLSRIKQRVSTKSLGGGSSVILRAHISEFIKVFMAQAEREPQLLTALFHKIHVKSGTTSGLVWEQCGLQDTLSCEAGWSSSQRENPPFLTSALTGFMRTIALNEAASAIFRLWYE